MIPRVDQMFLHSCQLTCEKSMTMPLAASPALSMIFPESVI